MERGRARVCGRRAWLVRLMTMYRRALRKPPQRADKYRVRVMLINELGIDRETATILSEILQRHDPIRVGRFIERLDHYLKQREAEEDAEESEETVGSDA